MTKIILSLAISIFSLVNVNGQELVRYGDITFASDLEKKVLDDHFLNHKTDLFMLFMANGGLLNESAVSEGKNRFYTHLSKFRTEKFSAKNNDKKIKAVYEDIHDSFLSKYELKNRFEEIFYNGYYNCVSASALYALAFEHLNIKYTIKEKPTHVYLIAYPESDEIVVEATSPVGGYVSIDNQFKQTYLRSLKDQKIISAQEYTSQNSNDLFDRYYFGEQENINLVQLAGIQYMNEGIFLSQENKHLEALQQFEKAYLLYPEERLAYLWRGALHEAFMSREKDLVHAACLAKLARCKKYGITSDMITGEFYRVIQQLLFEKGQKEKLNDYYSLLISSLDEEDMRKEISFVYHYENGRYFYNQARFKECLASLEECLKIKPSDQEANKTFISAVAQSVKSNTNIEVIKTLEAYAEKYSVLMENNIFNEMLGSSYLVEADFNFRSDKATEGEKYKTLFENFQKKHSDVSFDKFLVGQAYSAAAVYYFKKGQTTKARTIIATGLQLSPGNYELLTRKRMIE